jgi:hypothetical protein
MNAVGDTTTFKRVVEPLSLIGFGTEMFAAGDPPVDELGTHDLIAERVKTGRYMKMMFKDDRMVYGVTFKHSRRFPRILSGVRNGRPFMSVASQLYYSRNF